jgi:hypothetical protein
MIFGREARELGIEEQPPLRSWEDVVAGIAVAV